MTPFPKIHPYRGPADLVHAVGHVVVLEKIDGTNTRLGMRADDPARLVIGGRTLLEGEPGFSQPILRTVVDRMPGLEAGLTELVGELGHDVVLYGETCGGKIQRSGFLYGSTSHFLLFAARVGEAWCSWSTTVSAASPRPTLQQIAQRLSLATPPVLYQGPADAERFEGLLDVPSPYSVQRGFDRTDVDRTQEGIVIWADPLLRAPDGHPVVAKLKHPRRREYTAPDGASTLTDFAARAVNPERVRHAIEHLEASGRRSADPGERLDRIVKRTIQDVAREVPEYQDWLGTAGKAAVRGALADRARQIAEALGD